ncbi:MAG TPA: DUF1540 domain-containing protein [Ruminiclostridium sp.]
MNMNTDKNTCIQCTISKCANHSKSEEYCALNQIQVGTHESDPTVVQCTDCQSFVKK